MTAFWMFALLAFVAVLRIFRKQLHRFRMVSVYLLALIQWLFVYSAVREIASAPWSDFSFITSSFPFITFNPVTVVFCMAFLFVITSVYWYRFEKLYSAHAGIPSYKVLLSLLQSTAVPVYIYTAYGGDFAMTIFLVAYIAVNVLFYIRYVWKSHLIISFLILCVTALLGLSAFVGIVITPLSAFLAWFDLLKEAQAGGLIPLLFAVTGGVFTSVMGGLSYRYGQTGPLLGSLFVLTVLLSVIHQNALLAAAAFAMLIMSLVYLASRGKFRMAWKSLQPAGFVIVCAVLAALPFSLMHTVQGIAFIDGFASPFFKNTTVELFPDFPFLYSIEGYGYSFNQRKLGGKPALSKRAVFTVEAPRRSVLYLRTEIFDAYTGTGWIQSDILTKAAAQDRNSGYFIPLRASSSYERKCSITIHTDFYDHLPHTLDAYTFSSMREQIYDLKSGSAALGFTPEKPLVKNDILNVYKNQTADTGIRYRDSYLSVPDDIPREVVALAERLGSGIQSDPRKILSNIETYLAQNYTYSLEVAYFPKEAVDATWDFLFNSATGYCTHFATAYVLLARLNGIPARYASGFLVYMPNDRDSTVVTGLSAHAWPEVWLDGEGWSSREATPPMNPNVNDEFLYYGDYLTGSSFTSRQLSAMLENTDIDFADKETADPWEIPSFVGIAVIAVFLIAGIIFVFPKILIRLPSPDHAVETRRLLKRIVRYYRIYGFPPPSFGGWDAWSRRIALVRKDDEQIVTRISRISSRFSYGEGEPGQRDRRYLKLFIRRGFH